MKNIFIALATILFTTSPAYTQIIYVDSSATSGLNTGVTWEDAFLDLQSATQSAIDGQEIWVAKGTYLPTSGNDKTIYFELKSGVRLLGGFEGDEVDVSQRDWNENETILSGDIGVSGDSTDNAYTILYAAFTDTTTTVDGFIFEGGHAENDTATVSFSSPKKNGGAIYLNGSGGYAALNILNCEMRHNNANRYGGAIYLNGLNNGATGVKIVDCKMKMNSANRGGAVYQTGGVVNYFGNQILNSTFERNFTYGGFGGAISLLSIGGNVDYQFNSCIFLENHISGMTTGGGAISYNNINVLSDNFLSIKHCQFVSNSGGEGGAILFLGSGFGDDSFLINDCSFIKNSCDFNGIVESVSFSDYPDNLKIKNSLFENNIGGPVLTGIYNELQNCIFRNNTLGAYEGYAGFVLSPTNINNCTFFTNDTLKNDLIFSHHELIINNSIFYNDFLLEDTIIWTSSHLTLNNCLLTSPSCDSVIIAFYDTLLTCNNLILNADPLFRDTATGDFSLMACSPAIDAGDNSFYDFVENPIDFDDSERLINGAIDIGAYESPVTLMVDSVANVICFNDSTGIVFPVFNGPAPYSYAWSNGQTVGDDIENLEAGTYQLTVTDANDCSDSISFEVLEPDPIVIGYITDSISCHDSLDGHANSQAIGGLSPYVINWENGEIGNEAFALGEGYNLVSVTDANGCMIIDSVFIGEPLPINIVGSIINASGANNQDGSIEVTNIDGGTPPFELLWSNGETTGLIENLLPGDYLLTVTDANGCTYMNSFSVSFLDVIKTIEENEIRVFPNPVIASNPIYISVPEGWSTDCVFLYDSIGNLISSNLGERMDTDRLKIYCPNFGGIFILELHFGQEVYFKRIVVLN